MAGDTPTPMYTNKEGTPFNDGDGLEFRMASDFTAPYGVVSELRRANDSYPPSEPVPETASNVVEFKYPPHTPGEVAVLTERLIAARIFRMEPAETPFLRDEAA